MITPFPAGSRVTVRVFDEPLPGTVEKVIEFTNKRGEFHSRRVVMLDQPIDLGDVPGDTRRWNVALDDIVGGA